LGGGAAPKQGGTMPRTFSPFSNMTTAAYTPAENAQFLTELASKLSQISAFQGEPVERLNDLAAAEAEKDPAYVAYVNAKVRAALANPGQTYTPDEIREQIAAW